MRPPDVNAAIKADPFALAVDPSKDYTWGPWVSVDPVSATWGSSGRPWLQRKSDAINYGTGPPKPDLIAAELYNGPGNHTGSFGGIYIPGEYFGVVYWYTSDFSHSSELMGEIQGFLVTDPTSFWREMEATTPVPPTGYYPPGVAVGIQAYFLGGVYATEGIYATALFQRINYGIDTAIEWEGDFQVTAWDLHLTGWGLVWFDATKAAINTASVDYSPGSTLNTYGDPIVDWAWSTSPELRRLSVLSRASNPTIDLLTYRGSAPWENCLDPAIGHLGGLGITVAVQQAEVSGVPGPGEAIQEWFGSVVDATNNVTMTITAPRYRIGVTTPPPDVLSTPTPNLAGEHLDTNVRFFG